MEEIIFFAILLGVGYFFGVFAEKKHYQDIQSREQKTLSLAIASFGAKQPLPHASEAELFVGAVVISSDYFKTFVMALRNILGGELLPMKVSSIAVVESLITGERAGDRLGSNRNPQRSL